MAEDLADNVGIGQEGEHDHGHILLSGRAAGTGQGIDGENPAARGGGLWLYLAGRVGSRCPEGIRYVFGAPPSVIGHCTGGVGSIFWGRRDVRSLISAVPGDPAWRRRQKPPESAAVGEDPMAAGLVRGGERDQSGLAAEEVSRLEDQVGVVMGMLLALL